MHRKRAKIICVALVAALSLIILAFVFYEIWIVHLDGPGFRKKIINNNNSKDNPEKKNKLSFLTTGHVRGTAVLYDKQTEVQKMHSDSTEYNMLSTAFLNSIDKINVLNPDLVFITGDLIALEYPLNQKRLDVKKEKALFEYCWDQIFSQLKKINSEVVVIPGNHDIYNRIGAKIYMEKVGNYFRSFSYKDIRFVVLNSSKIEKDVAEYYVGPEKKWPEPQRISVDQIDFLREGFSKDWREKSVFIFVHHNPKSIPLWEKDIHPILCGTNCKAVFSGTNWGRLKYNTFDGISYIDGGFDLKELVPSYFVKTTVYENNGIEFSIFPVLPDKLTAKIRMASNSLKRYITAPF